MKNIFRKSDDFGGSKRFGHGRGLFYFLGYFLVFAIGINLGKTISDREHAMSSSLAINVTDAGGEDGARERFKKQVSVEIERRIRNQIEEQVTAEMENALTKEKAAAEQGDGENVTAKNAESGADDTIELPKTKSKKSAAEKPARKVAEAEAPAKRTTSSVGVYSIELSRHDDKATAEKAQRKIQEKGLKAFRRKVASVDGEVDYRVYLGKFETKEEAKTFQSTVLSRKGIKNTGKVKKIDP
ncbi:MAG: SPOR domain-containing protein [Bdellovibrionia bacterium]